MDVCHTPDSVDELHGARVGRGWSTGIRVLYLNGGAFGSRYIRKILDEWLNSLTRPKSDDFLELYALISPDIQYLIILVKETKQ